MIQCLPVPDVCHQGFYDHSKTIILAVFPRWMDNRNKHSGVDALILRCSTLMCWMDDRNKQSGVDALILRWSTLMFLSTFLINVLSNYSCSGWFCSCWLFWCVGVCVSCAVFIHVTVRVWGVLAGRGVGGGEGAGVEGRGGPQDGDLWA